MEKKTFYKAFQVKKSNLLIFHKITFREIFKQILEVKNLEIGIDSDMTKRNYVSSITCFSWQCASGPCWYRSKCLTYCQLGRLNLNIHRGNWVFSIAQHRHQPIREQKRCQVKFQNCCFWICRFYFRERYFKIANASKWFVNTNH